MREASVPYPSLLIVPYLMTGISYSPKVLFSWGFSVRT